MQCHPIEPFKPTCEKIEDYKERSDFYCTAHGIAEGVFLHAEAQDRKQDDIQRVTSLLAEYVGLLLLSLMLYIYWRLGKKSGNSEKSRLIKIAVSSIEEKSAVLCNRLKLRNKEHPNHIRKVFITQFRWIQ